MRGCFLHRRGDFLHGRNFRAQHEEGAFEVRA
jgi:hypothetical protein